MSDVRATLLNVRAKRTLLEAQYPEGCCTLVSVQSDTHNTKGGLTMEVPLDNAARHLVEGTHRIATEDEIKAFRTAQAEARKRILSAEQVTTRTLFLAPQRKPKDGGR